MNNDDKVHKIGLRLSKIFIDENLSPLDIIKTSIPFFFAALHLVYLDEPQTAQICINSVVDLLKEFVDERIAENSKPEESTNVH